jgi:HK97 family phage major capsid protein
MEIDIDDRAPETKAGVPGDSLVTHDEMMRTFESFRQANDDRIAAERKSADVLNEDKVARINAKLDELSMKGARPHLAGSYETAAAGPAQREHKKAFEDYVRHGESSGLRALETKSMSISSNPDGGYLVPPEVERAIGERLATISPIRAISGVRTVSSSVYKKPFMISGPATGWVGETDARPQTGTPTLTRSPSRPWSSTPCRRRPRACSKTPPSTSTSGSPARSSRPLPCRRAPPSSLATG